MCSAFIEEHGFPPQFSKVAWKQLPLGVLHKRQLPSVVVGLKFVELFDQVQFDLKEKSGSSLPHHAALTGDRRSERERGGREGGRRKRQ